MYPYFIGIGLNQRPDRWTRYGRYGRYGDDGRYGVYGPLFYWNRITLRF